MVPFLYNLPIFQPFLPGLALINSRNEFNNRPREENRGEIVSAMIPPSRLYEAERDGSREGEGLEQIFFHASFDRFDIFFFLILSFPFFLRSWKSETSKKKINELY